MTSRVARLARLAGGASAGGLIPVPLPAARVALWTPRRSPLGPRVSAATSGASFLASVGHVSAGLRAGGSPADAWWRGMGVPTEGGVPRWGELAARCGSDLTAARAVHAATRLSAEVGTAPAVMLDHIVDGLARDAEADGQRRAAMAGPRATARLLAGLPALGLLLGVALGADPAAVLLDGGGGSALGVAGALLTLLGHRWSRRYLRAAVAAGVEE